ncbi:trypsin-like serine peptidase [Streptomyces boninensis]|uniref:trypsin-like serine peptidase n=1 Tax=Streptomyces boninensis TaxID=2039455 RepID=UPI003B21E7FD
MNDNPHGQPVRRRARTGRIAASLAAVGALIGGAVASAAPAGAAPSPWSHDASHQATNNSKSLSSFWSPERMRSAQPLDLLPADAADLGAKVRESAKKLIPPTSPKALPEGGGPWTGDGKVVQTSGRVFFTYQGRTASCSGNAVTSANKSTVLTAGHCVKMEGAWHKDWVFVPGYHDGQAPLGKWTAAKTLSTPQWSASEDLNYDVGAAVVNPLDGKQLTDVTGAQGVAFNTGYNVDMYAFGFPAASPYDGEKLIYCSGRTSKDFLLSQDHGLNCDMTGGSSGGPWFTKFDEVAGTGLQSSVNSFKYNFLPTMMFGPYFGADAQKLYEEAQNA